MLLLIIWLIFSTAILCSALPLLVYGTTLAAFGLPHVAAEMRYVYQRFRTRWSKGYVLTTASILLMIVGTRILLWTQTLSTSSAKPLELGLVTSLIALTLPMLWQRSSRTAILGLLLVIGVAWGTITHPILTALCLAILHNFTPIGFFYEALPDPKRRHVMTVCLALFVGMPLFIATGLPFRWLSSVGLTAPEATLINLGSLAQHIGVYVPKAWQAEAFAVPFFSAMVFAQCMHYAAVIHVLPRLGITNGSDNRKWAIFLFCLGGLTLASFSAEFFTSRRAYGLFAAVHAWIEVPILLAALMGPIPVEKTLKPLTT